MPFVFGASSAKKYYFKDSTGQESRRKRSGWKDLIQLKIRLVRCVLELSFFMGPLFIYKLNTAACIGFVKVSNARNG